MHRLTRQGSTVTVTCLLTGQDWFLLTTVMFGTFASTFAEWRSAETPALNKTRIKNATAPITGPNVEAIPPNTTITMRSWIRAA